MVGCDFRDYRTRFMFGRCESGGREASAISLYDLCFLAGDAWGEQVGRAVGE